MRPVYATPGRALDIGRYPENDTVKVVFDVKCWRQQYPAGSIALLHQRPGDDGAQPVAGLTVGSKDAEWLVSNADVLNAGEGIATLILVNGGQVELSESWKTVIGEPVTEESETPPEPIVSYMTAVIEAVESYDAMTAEAEDGNQTSAHIDRTGDHPVLHIVIKNNGGGGGADIDDDHTRTDKTWSSKKISDELGTKADEEDLSSLSETIVNLPQNRTSADSGMDLDISDESGHVLMRLADGEVKTKEFDSAKAAKMQNSIDSSADMDFVDPAGNVVLRVQDGHIQTKKFNSRNINPKIITLKADGTGDFPTLKAAIESITDADPDSNPYEIHVYPGTYDTLEGYTEEQIESADIGGGYTDNSFVGAKLTDGISLIGIGNRENIILTAELATADYDIGVRGNISTLNLQGSGRVENVSIHAENLRYCIHDDFGCDHIVRRTLKNVVFSGSNLSYDPFTSYGSGIPYGGMIALFEDCDFGFNFGMHTRQLMKVCSVVELRNCSGHQVILGDNANDNDVASHQFILNGCNFDSLKVSRTNGTTTPHMFISGTSKDMMIFEPGIYIVQTGDVVKTALTALDEGTLVAFATGAEKLTKAASAAVAYGVIVKKDTEYDYVQKSGFINAAWVGLTGLSIGDYVTVNSDMELVTGGTSSNAVGVVVYTHSTTAIIKLL